MLTRLASALLLLTSTVPATAAGSFQAVGFTANSEEEARGRITELVDIKLFVKVIGFATELPKIYEPNALSGAPRDKWVVILSICSSKKGEAKKLAATIKDRAKDVTLFQVKGDFAGMCLPRRALEPMSEEESRFVQGILKDPKRAKPHNQYANFLQSKNRLDEAEAQLKKALELEPDDFEAKNLLQVIEVMRHP